MLNNHLGKLVKKVILSLVVALVMFTISTKSASASSELDDFYEKNKNNQENFKAYSNGEDVTEKVKNIIISNSYDVEKALQLNYDNLEMSLDEEYASNYNTRVATKTTRHRVNTKCYIGGNQYIAWTGTVKGTYTVDLNKQKVISARNPTISLKMTEGNGNLSLLNYEPSYRIYGDRVDFYYWYSLETQLLDGTNCRIGSFTDTASGGAIARR